jgi:hypothetical protein
MRRRTLRAALGLATLGLSASACMDDFLPSSRLAGLRVLSIASDPLEVGPGESVTLTPLVFAPEGAGTPTQSWTFCPISAGPRAGYACLVASCEKPVTPRADGRVTARPYDLALACLAELAASGATPPSGAPMSMADIPETIEVFFRHRVTLGAETRESVARLDLYTRGAPPVRNRPPRITGLTIGGMPVATSSTATKSVALADLSKVEVKLAIDPASLDADEEAIVSYYSTAGRFDTDRTDGLDGAAFLETDEDDGPFDAATLYVVVRDGRGGQAAVGPIALRKAP